MKKAITPIISIIILLFITVGLLGGIWPYMSEYFETMMKAIDIPPGATYCRENKVTIVIRNPGQSPINNSDRMAMLGLFHDHPDAVGAWQFEGDGNATQDSSPNSNTGSIYGDTVLLMHFDEGSGNITDDETSYGNEGNLTGHEPEWKSSGCQSGRCLRSYGGWRDDYVEVPDTSSLRNTVGSWSFWIWADSGWVVSPSALIRKIGGGGYAIAYWPISNEISMARLDQFGSWVERLYSGANTVPAEEWLHVVYTVDGSDNVTVYINGDYADSMVWAEPIVAGTDSIEIGGRSDGWGFNGTIDEVAIYSRALTRDEVNDLYEAGRAKFIERGKLGRFGYGMEFDGVDDYVDVGDIGNIKTISYWIKANSDDEYVMDLDGGTHYIEHNSYPVGFTDATVYVDGVQETTLGSELVTNGDFASDITGWSNYYITTFEWDAGELHIEQNTMFSTHYFYQDIGLVVGRHYKYSFDVTDTFGYSINLYFQQGTDSILTIPDTGSYSGTFLCTDASDIRFRLSSGVSGWNIDNVSIKQVSDLVSSNQWHHVVITTDTAINADSVTLGKYSSNYFNGYIDEVVILNEALTPEQITAQLTPACSCTGNTCECGELTITRTAGEGYFHPYFDKGTIEPEGSVRMTDYNCMSDICTYRITSPAASIKIDVECS